MTRLSIWQMVLTEGAALKKEQLDREIGRLKDPNERANLSHTYSKLMMFMAEDIERALKIAGRQPYGLSELDIAALCGGKNALRSRRRS